MTIQTTKLPIQLNINKQDIPEDLKSRVYTLRYIFNYKIAKGDFKSVMRELTELLGVSKRQVQNYARHEKDVDRRFQIPKDKIPLICEYFGIAENDLYT